MKVYCSVAGQIKSTVCLGSECRKQNCYQSVKDSKLWAEVLRLMLWVVLEQGHDVIRTFTGSSELRSRRERN